MPRELASGHHGFDGVAVGDWLRTDTRTITTDDIDDFARLSGDYFEIHMDRDAARRHGFADRVAHGLLDLSITDGLKNQAAARFNAQASLNWDWSFRAPVLAGDTVQATLTIAEKRAIRDPERGILRIRFEVKTQNGDVVQDGWNQLMVYR